MHACMQTSRVTDVILLVTNVLYKNQVYPSVMPGHRGLKVSLQSLRA